MKTLAKSLNQLGSPMELVGLFGDSMQYQWVMVELGRKSYRVV